MFKKLKETFVTLSFDHEPRGILNGTWKKIAFFAVLIIKEPINFIIFEFFCL